MKDEKTNVPAPIIDEDGLEDIGQTTFTVTFSDSGVTTGAPTELRVNVTFSENVGSFIAASVFTMSGGGLSSSDFLIHSYTPFSGDGLTIETDIPTTHTGGTFTLTLQANAFGTGKPATAQSYHFTNITAVPATGFNSLPSYFCYFGVPSYNNTSRAITVVLTTPNETGTLGLWDQTDSNFRNWTAGIQINPLKNRFVFRSDGWSINITGTGTTRTIVATPDNTIVGGNYQVLLTENAFGTGRPARSFSSMHTTIRAPGYSAVWGSISYSAPTRSIRSTLTVNVNPGSAFSASADFKVEVRSGTDGSYRWATSSGWTFGSTTTDNLSYTITATPANTVAAGVYRLVLREDAFGTDRPNADVSSGPQTVTVYYTATWSSVSYLSATRGIRSTLTLSEDPGSGFSASADFKVEVRSGTVAPYSWATSSGWTFGSTGSGVSRTITATPASNVIAGTYRLVLREDAFGTDKPYSDRVSAGRAIGAYEPPFSATWASQTPTPNIVDRSITTTLTLSHDPGSTFSVSNDFIVQSLSGSTWSTASGWTLSSTGSGLVRSITATPSSSVIARTYRLLLQPNSFGSGRPPSALPSSQFTLGAPPSGTRTITVNIPQSSIGAIQLALKARSFNVLGQTSQVGPEFQQYLGTVYYDTGGGVDVIPSIAIGGGSFCTTSRRVTWTAYVTDATETELTAFTVADVSANNVTSVGASITPTLTLTVTRMPATGSSFQIQTNPIPVNRAGDMSVTVVANALGANTNKSVTSSCVAYDTRTTVTPLIATWQYANYCSTSDRVFAALQFNKAITNLDVRSPSLDIQVANDRQNANLTGWTLSFSGHTGSGQTAALAANTNLVIEATPPANTNRDVYLHVNADSVTSGTQTGPDSMVYSETIPVNNVPVEPPDEPPSIAIDGGSYCTTSRRVTWTAYVTGATDTELDAFTNADTTINNVTSAGTSFTPTETVTRMPAGGSSFQIQTDPLPVDKAGDMSVTVAANALGANTNKSVTSSCVFYDTRPAGTPTVATARWGTPASSDWNQCGVARSD